MSLELCLNYGSVDKHSTDLGNVTPRVKYKSQDRYKQNLHRNVLQFLQEGEVIELNNIQDLIRKSADTPVIGVKRFKQNWFNYRCCNARRKTMALLNELRCSVGKYKIDVFRKYDDQRRKYKVICEESKKAYDDHISREINAISTGKQW